MKVSLSIEKDERHALNIECCVQGLSEQEAKARWADLMSSVEKFLSQERQEENDSVRIRHGDFF